MRAVIRRTRWTALSVLAVAAVAFLGCGGGGSNGAATQTTSTTASKQVFRCLFLHGFKPEPDQTQFGGYDPSGKTAPGYENGLAIRLSGVGKPVIVSFYDSSTDAAKSEHFESAIVKGTSGGTRSQSNVVVFHGTPVPPAELSRIEDCAFSS